jgi:hypothetical protein
MSGKRTRQRRESRRKGQEAGRPVLKRGNESTQRVEQSLLPYPHALAFAFARTKPFAFQVIFSTVLLLMLPLPSDGNTAPETRISLLPLPPTGHIASERKSQRRAVGQDCPKNPKSQSVCSTDRKFLDKWMRMSGSGTCVDGDCRCVPGMTTGPACEYLTWAGISLALSLPGSLACTNASWFCLCACVCGV